MLCQIARSPRPPAFRFRAALIRHGFLIRKEGRENRSKLSANDKSWISEKTRLDF
jgi:hypothetical protein